MDERGPFPPDFQLFVASKSPRRHALLRDVGIPFTIVASEGEERLSGGSVRVLAESNALAKVQGAKLPAAAAPGAFVLGIDTLVARGRTVMGKPNTAEEAGAMLRTLSGRTHRVVSGVALARTGGAGDAIDMEKVKVASGVTSVTFATLDHWDVEAYVASEEWMDKAGAYAVQGLAAFFVTRLTGEYSNVVGLPLGVLCGLLRESGFDPLSRKWLQGGQER